MGRKVTPYSEFITQFNNKSQGQYSYIDGYTRMSKKINIKCNVCGHEFSPVASYFINTDTGCKNCDLIKRSQISSEMIEKQKQAIKDITNNEYELLKYNGMKEEASFLHRKCNEKFNTIYESFVYKGYRCKCNRRKNDRYTVNELKQKYKNNDYEIIDVKYPGPIISVKCKKCNTVSEVRKSKLDNNAKLDCCKK